MRIMVFDVPAESGGALTIINEYYDKAFIDKENIWYFVISTPTLKETENIKVLNYPWIKKSWFHRLFFDKFIAHILVEKYNADEVLSLQNVIIPRVKVKQTLYLHQPLPFVEKRFRLTENLTFWLYQNIISKMIFKSIKKADRVIVQTNWMKDACLKKVDTDSSKFIVIQPEINIKIEKKYIQEDSQNKLFIYPASGFIYKNHQLIVEAVKTLKEQNITNFKVVFTLSGNENNNIEKLYRIVKKCNLPIAFIGHITLEEVYKYYGKSILIFPSYIETFGLPLLEARIHGTPILASDSAFSHEILNDYNKATFFNSFDSKGLATILIKNISEID